MQMEHGPKPKQHGNRMQREREGKNCFNSGVTREMQGYGSCGFYRQGIMREWAQTAAMRRGLLNGNTVGQVMKSEEGQDMFLDLWWATGDVFECTRLLVVVVVVGGGC